MDRVDEYLQYAVELATTAGRMIEDGCTKTLNIDTKRNRRDMVTEFDRAIEKFIFDSLRNRYADHVFIGEESANTERRLLSDAPTWIVDPIDGTMNFVHHYPMCCVSIGLAINKQLVIGVINAPFLGKLYTALKGKGAHCNGLPIQVSAATRIEQSMVLSEFSGFANERARSYAQRFFDSILWKCQAVRMIGSACICLCLIADGSADVYLHPGLQIWDMAAGYVIVSEAGGIVLTMNGDPFEPHSKNILACSTCQLSKQVLQTTLRPQS